MSREVLSEEDLRAEAIFRRGSKTYYGASRAFPASFRIPLAILYAFVRSADDYVDAQPQDAQGFREFRNRWTQARAGRQSGDPVVDRFAKLCREKGFEASWVEAFLDAMEADLSIKTYETEEAVLKYIYGSAEVIGLFMCRLMDLPTEAWPSAQMLGRAMQYVNFIRDFAEDRGLGRRYLPLEGRDPGVFDPAWAKAHPEEFADYIKGHLNRYKAWGKAGRQGFSYIPLVYRRAIATAQDLYDWSARKIEANPLLVWERQVKPPKRIIVVALLRNYLFMHGGR